MHFPVVNKGSDVCADALADAIAPIANTATRAIPMILIFLIAIIRLLD
jgi:hypothetical protein